jgi:hypothetical protein
MKTQHLILLAFFSVVLFGACSNRLTYFTDDLNERYRWTDDELRKIQFYVSQNIVLKREVSGGDREIISGKIKIEDGRKIEEVVIRKGTPGAFLFSPKRDRFAIGFEDGNDRYLMFGPSPKFRHLRRQDLESLLRRRIRRPAGGPAQNQQGGRELTGGEGAEGELSGQFDSWQGAVLGLPDCQI